MKRNNLIDKSKDILKSRKDIIIILLSIFIVVLFYLLPTPSGLSHDGQVMIGILIMAAILWITEAIPLAVTGLLIMILQPLMGVIPAK
ncbi:MAG: anion permease, partial [Thermoplasmatales archaeon]|nr:anion permease [Thermoplasmatales archaeon]